MHNVHTDGLAGEGVNDLDNVGIGDAISTEDTLADTNTVFSGGGPVELLHTTVTDEGGIKGREVISSDNDGDTWVLLLVVHSWELHVGGVVSDVHECCVDHLVVDRVLCCASHASCSCVKIVDEEAAHLSLLYYVCCLTVPLSDQLCWLSCVPTF